MSGTQERIRAAVEAIQGWLADTPKPGEAVVRQAIVLRLLHAAGFDIWNPAEVVPEETNQSKKRADLMIRVGQGSFALELKGMNASFQPGDYQQVVGYAGNKGMRWAMLTNGGIWIVMDRTHNPTGTFQDHEVLKLGLHQGGYAFADDLALLLDAETWRVDAFAEAVQTIKSRREQRKAEKRIFKEKAPIVEAFQQEHGIGTFGQAAILAAKLKQITEAERDVLLGMAVQKAESTNSSKPLKPQPPQKAQPSGTDAEQIHFTYCLLGAEAHAVYKPADGSWTVKAGSTALNRVLGENGTNAKGIQGRRQSSLKAGQLVEKNAELLEYVKDVVYGSASTSAMDIAGASRNGWDCWKDAQGRPAQDYRPKPV
ncbi:DUF4357 domain-containing protein [Deinococcus marmoris]|uniref:DUF4357 domain-containing protein n=1 Tax=Deinococcus marmoris TaxID=249408 RepID=UPI0004976817|nr:DUF4357 domain-containing protein [Deinococcus marmoris]